MWACIEELFLPAYYIMGTYLFSETVLCSHPVNCTWSMYIRHIACMHAKSPQSSLTLCNPSRLPCPWDSLGKNTEVGWHVLLHGIFLTQGLNSCLLCLLHREAGTLPLVPPGKSIFYISAAKLIFCFFRRMAMA